MNNIFSSLADLRTWAGRCLKRPAVHMHLGPHRYRFADETEFAFCISARTAVTAERTNTLYHAASMTLEAEVGRLAKLEGQLTTIRDDYLEHDLSLARTFQVLGTRMISNDHHWRDIFDQLLAEPHPREIFLRHAVDTYLRYLAERRDVIGSLLVLKEQATAAAPEAKTQVFTRPVELPGSDTDCEALALNRLPRGRGVKLRLQQGQSLAIRLARHAFALCHEQDWALIAANGQRYILREGLNSVGRSRRNNVAIDSGLRNISREHLHAQLLDGDTILLTDLSTGGTFVPPGALLAG